MTNEEIDVITQEVSSCQTNLQNCTDEYKSECVSISKNKSRFSCWKCDLKFAHMSHLRVHLRIHNDERPFLCGVCDKSFKRLQQCRVHQRISHDGIRWPCDECGKTFSDVANVRRHHLAIHLHLKRWICGLCGLKFTFSQSLREHLERQHEVKIKVISTVNKKSQYEVYVLPTVDASNNDSEVRKLVEIAVWEEQQKIDEIRNRDQLYPSKFQSGIFIKELCQSAHDKKIIVASNDFAISPSGEETQMSENEVVATNSSSVYVQLLPCDDFPVSITQSVPQLVCMAMSACGICGTLTSSSEQLRSHLDVCHRPVFQCLQCLQNGEVVVVDSAENCRKHLTTMHNSADTDAFQIVFANGDSALSVDCENGGLVLLGHPLNEQPLLLSEQPLSDSVINSVPGKCTMENSNKELTLTKELPDSSSDLEWASVIVLENDEDSNLRLQSCGNSALAEDLQAVNSTSMASILLTLAETATDNCTEISMRKQKGLKENKVCVIKSVQLRQRSKVETKKKKAKRQARKPTSIMEFDKFSLDMLSCTSCGKRFPSLLQLERHRRCHQSSKFPCHVCGKSFAERFNLHTHSLTHSGERPLACSMCERTFRYHRDLTDHCRIEHLRVKIHVCDFCQRQFARQRELKRHLKVHSDVVHMCPICNVKFRSLSYLNCVHMHKHEPARTAMEKKTDVNVGKKHMCNICGKVFACARYLSAHTKVHERRFNYQQCVQCPRMFTSEDKLKIHYETFHQILSSQKKDRLIFP